MAYQKYTATEIIELFELQVNDVTELATAEELKILNRVYLRVCSLRPWEFLKNTASGSISQDSVGYYIDIPDGFYSFTENANYTNNTMEYQGNANPKVIFVGTTYEAYQIVNFSDRRQYLNKTNYAYLDMASNKIRFTTTPVAMTYEFDFYKLPDKLTANDYPVFPGNFHEFLAYGMAVENDILQLSEKARSYRPENEKLFKEEITNMAYWNSLQYQN